MPWEVVYHTCCQRNQTCLGGCPQEPGLKLGRKQKKLGGETQLSASSLLIFPSNRRCATLFSSAFRTWGVAHSEPEKLSTQALLHFQKSNLSRYFFGQKKVLVLSVCRVYWNRPISGRSPGSLLASQFRITNQIEISVMDISGISTPRNLFNTSGDLRIVTAPSPSLKKSRIICLLITGLGDAALEYRIGSGLRDY